MSKTEEHADAAKFLEQHEKKPAETGCMWRHRKKGKPCDYWKHSFDASKAHPEVFGLSSSTYWKRAQRITPKQAEYERQADARAEAKKKEAAREQAKIDALKGKKQTTDVKERLAAARKKLEKAKAFKRSDFLKRHLAMYRGPLDRLRLNHGNAWDVGAVAPPTLLASADYMGKEGVNKAKRKGLLSENHDPYGLGMWYPYDHNHHHLVPVNEVAKMIGKTSGTVTLADRIYVLVKSKWNVNYPENLLILPENVTVAKILGLPAHCPWDRASHPKYSALVSVRLNPVSQSINTACEEPDKEKKHKARDAVAASLKARLEFVSEELFGRVTSGDYSGRELGDV